MRSLFTSCEAKQSPPIANRKWCLTGVTWLFVTIVFSHGSRICGRIRSLRWQCVIFIGNKGTYNSI
jgi:hypothetical protein